MKYNASISVHRGLMELMEVICSVGTRNSVAHGRSLTALVPDYRMHILELLTTRKEQALELITAVIKARYPFEIKVSDGTETDFPPELRPQLREALIMVAASIPIAPTTRFPTFAILPTGFVLTANEPTAQGIINPWPR